MSYISLKVSERRLPTYFFVQAILRVRMFEKFAFTFADGFGTKTCLSWLVTKGQNAGGNSTYLSHHMSVSMAHGSFGSISNSETMLSKTASTSSSSPHSSIMLRVKRAYVLSGSEVIRISDKNLYSHSRICDAMWCYSCHTLNPGITFLPDAGPGVFVRSDAGAVKIWHHT